MSTKRYIRKEIKFTPDEWAEVCGRAEFLRLRTGTYIRRIAVFGTLKEFNCRSCNSFIVSFQRIGCEIEQVLRIAKNSNSPYTNEIEKMLAEYNALCKKFYKYLSPLKAEVLP